MTRYQLAKIVAWSETLHSRKRMQKVTFLLQVAGCPIDANFILHHYGPYSQEVSRLSDEMVQAKMLEERSGLNLVGQQYSYRVSDETLHKIAEFEAHPDGSVQAELMAPFEELARQLFRADLRELEVAATIVYFRKQGNDWPLAVEKACRFKDLLTGTPFLQEAEAFARGICA